MTTLSALTLWACYDVWASSSMHHSKRDKRRTLVVHTMALIAEDRTL